MLNSKIALYYENEHFTYGWYFNIRCNTVDTAKITLNDTINNKFMDKMKYDMNKIKKEIDNCFD